MPHPNDFSRLIHVDTFGKDLMKISKWFEKAKNVVSGLDDVNVLSSFAPEPTPEDVLAKEMDKIVKEVKKHFPGTMELPICPRRSNNIPPNRTELIDKIGSSAPSSSKRKREEVITTTTTTTTGVRKSKRIRSKSVSKSVTTTTTKASVIDETVISEQPTKKGKKQKYVAVFTLSRILHSILHETGSSSRIELHLRK